MEPVGTSRPDGTSRPMSTGEKALRSLTFSSRLLGAAGLCCALRLLLLALLLLPLVLLSLFYLARLQPWKYNFSVSQTWTFFSESSFSRRFNPRGSDT